MTHRYRKDVAILDINGGKNGKFGQYWLCNFAENFSNFGFLYSSEFNSHRPLQRIFSLARRAGCDRLLFENIKLREEDIVPSVRTFFAQETRSNALRISFLKRLDKKRREDFPESSHYKMVGYVVFLRGIGSFSVQPGQVYEAVLDPCWKTRDAGPFVHCAHNYEVETSIGLFCVKGVLYTQQNTNSTFCLHAAMRTALSCVLPENDIKYGEIISAIEKHLKVKNPAEDGLFEKDSYVVKELVALLKDLSRGQTDCIPLQLERNSEFFYRVLYEWIESGVPVILGYNYSSHPGIQEGHAVTLIGHTFDDHIWAPAANQMYFPGNGISMAFSSSESYVNSFVLHDDNCGPYLTLPKNFFNNERFFTNNNSPIIFGLPRRRMAIDGNEAEHLAHQALNSLFVSLIIEEDSKNKSWFDILYRHFLLNRLVLRSFTISYEKYMTYLTNEVHIEPRHLEKISQEIPKNQVFWMVEISCHELFGISKLKFGEVLLYDIDVSKNGKNKVQNVFAMARLPQVIFFDLDGGKKFLDTEVDKHTPLITLEQYI